MEEFVIFVEGLDGIDLSKINKQIASAAQKAINKTADRTRVASVTEMRKQVNFPARYLRGSSSRLKVTKKALAEDLVAEITGRSRPTSLARFALSAKQKDGINVSVKPGRAKIIKGAFLMRLRSGSDGSLGNTGLAVRTKDGKKPNNAWKPVPLGNGLWLLYGPSVDQVFKGVRGDVSQNASAFLKSEFERLLNLDIGV